MQQIKLLKPLTIARNPQIVRPRPNDPVYQISTTISLTNDLGEQFFYGDTTVTLQLRSYADDNRSKINKDFRVVGEVEEAWNRGKRALDFKVLCSMKELSFGKFISVHAYVKHSAKTIDAMNYDELTTEELIRETLEGLNITLFDRCEHTTTIRASATKFIPISSDLLEIPMTTEQLPVKTDRIALRELSDTLLYEELSGSIARHVWDAGNLVVNLSQEQLFNFLSLDAAASNSNLKVLELGTGIGLAAIHLSRMLKDATVIATDLQDAREICAMNIKLNHSSVKFEQLDWENEQDAGTQWDIVFTTDCTYNPSYYDALLHVLKRETGTGTKVMISHKFREPYTESEFFTKASELFSLDRQIWYSDGATLIHMGLYIPL